MEQILNGGKDFSMPTFFFEVFIPCGYSRIHIPKGLGGLQLKKQKKGPILKNFKKILKNRALHVHKKRMNIIKRQVNLFISFFLVCAALHHAAVHKV